jgi:GNAT superfamily N-acetyltransferase
LAQKQLVFSHRSDIPIDISIMIKAVDSWFLALVATDPEYRRRGYATAILEAIKQQVRMNAKRLGPTLIHNHRRQKRIIHACC